MDDTIIDHAPTVAFLSWYGLKTIPFKKKSGRVAWIVEGDVYTALAELQSNVDVPILDYIQRLSSIRTSIFTLKKNRDGQ